MVKKIEQVVFAAMLMSVAAYGQAGLPPGPPPGPHGAFGPEHFSFHSRKVVTGAPYSADITDQMIQTLADGNTIQHTTTGHTARDRQGRTYVQQTITGGLLVQNGPTTITFISDPVAGYSYVLNPTTKTAMRRAIKTPTDAENPPSPRGSFSPGNPHPDSANRVETDLGTQTISGVTAQGKSVTHTIPSGAIGNAQPVVSTSETWYSPDLQIPVLAKRNDPRSGQSTYTVTNIQRGDPPASLFQIPSDYTIQDASAMHQERGGGPGFHVPPHD
ncbi:MAG: hypothetical protein JOZ48_19445 [Acidobacteriaceae bacterium]|nr:hypothetical protein [Acidobacteriaceae bacterium]